MTSPGAVRGTDVSAIGSDSAGRAENNGVHRAEMRLMTGAGPAGRDCGSAVCPQWERSPAWPGQVHCVRAAVMGRPRTPGYWAHTGGRRLPASHRYANYSMMAVRSEVRPSRTGRRGPLNVAAFVWPGRFRPESGRWL